MKNLYRFFIAFTLISAVALMSSPVANAAKANKNKKAYSLEGTDWHLSMLRTKIIKPVDGVEPVVFAVNADNDAVKATGFAGCNRYFGAVTKDTKNLWISGIGSTKMACTEEAMNVESTYLELLAEVKTYKVKKDKLTLFNAEGMPILTFLANE